jgi:uncharacterized protein YdiU (UPF0061 family)
LAGERNFFSLATALAPLLDEVSQAEIREVLIPAHLPAAEQAICEVYKAKLGLFEWGSDSDGPAALFEDMDILMEETEADYTMYWRQLSLLPGMFLPAAAGAAGAGAAGSSSETFADLYSDDTLMQPLAEVFYRPLKPHEVVRWAEVLRRWLVLLHGQLQQHEHGAATSGCGESPAAAGLSSSGASISAQMCRVNPKYVPREWMLVEAYQAAAQGDTAPLERLQALFATPYDEHSSEDERLFYRKMPAAMLNTGGVTVMT